MSNDTRKMDRIALALRRHGLWATIDGLGVNPATPGEVVVWIAGTGHPVSGVREALKLVAAHNPA